jgi:hypothetical protein
MSAPAFAWAFEKGHELGLTSSQLVLLLYMADQANCAGVFYTGQPRLAKYSRLTERGVRKLVPQLEALGLIRVQATPGKPTVYHILRQPIGAELSSSPEPRSAQEPRSSPANGAGVTPEPSSALPRNPVPLHPGTRCQQPRNQMSVTPEPGSADPYITQEEDPKTRVTAQRSAGFKNSEPQGGTPPPAPPLPRAPTIGATDGGGSGYRKPVPGASAFAPVEEARAVFADYLAGLRQDRAAAKPAQPDRRADTAAVKRAVGATIYSLRKYAAAPGVAAVRSRSEQIDQTLHGEVLCPIRRGPVEAERTPEQQYAQLLGVSLAEAAAALAARAAGGFPRLVQANA